MNRSRLVVGLMAVFAGMTALLSILAFVARDPVPLFAAVPMAAATYFFWYHATGRIREGIHQRARRQAGEAAERRFRFGRRDERPPGGFGAGPREDWTPPGGDARFRYRTRQADVGQGGARARGGAGRTRTSPGATPDAITDREAYRVLGVDRSADEAQVRRAYRERVKEVHPDRGGDEETFKRVTRAYEHLTD